MRGESVYLTAIVLTAHTKLKMNRPTRDHVEILKEIDKLLKVNGFETERLRLENEIRASSTGSEVCMRSCSYLLNIKQVGPIDHVIGEQIDELIAYCNYNGLYPEKPSRGYSNV